MNVVDTFRLNDRVALVTGGAGRYGRQMVEALAEAGATVYTASRNLEPLEAMASEHRTLGHDVRAIQLDLGEEASILAVRDRILTDAGRIDVLVNNAYSPPVEFNAPAEEYAESLRVNGLGLFLITRAIGDVMESAKGGSIINIGSIFGMLGADRWVCEGTSRRWALPDYYFHKGGMLNLTRFIASYYGASNVRCNCIAAGAFWTDDMPEDFTENYNRTTCLGRLASSTDMKGIVVFLASDASSYITGANIPVDGGRTAI